LGRQRERRRRLMAAMLLAACSCTSQLSRSAAAQPPGSPYRTSAPHQAVPQYPPPSQFQQQPPTSARSATSALLHSSAAAPLDHGLIEQLPPQHRLPAAGTASLPTAMSGRVPAMLTAHTQRAQPEDALPAPVQPAGPPPAPELVAAPPVQLPVQLPVQPPDGVQGAPPGGPPGGPLGGPPNQMPIQQPAGGRWLRMPAAGSGVENVELSMASDLVSLTARDAPLSTVLSLIAEQHGLNIVTGADVTEQITVKITNARLEDALDAILATNGYTWARRSNIIIISKMSGDKKSSPAVQGRQVQVFSLNYMSATDADKVVQGLLSPVGQSFITATVPTDHRRTHEQLVVEDLPDYVHRIEQYLMQADTAPRQVQIETHVLQVTLKDNCRHGVNFKEILHIAHTDVTVSTAGLASGTAPASMIRLQGSDLDSLLEALKSTTDAKTLASPKVTVLNNQEAHMQVGGKIGYLLSTTTQTSTLQSVNFLDVGVILTVLPSITADGQILIRVAPQVSTGRINPTTNLPESETTEVETRVLLADGEAIVIGGLIKETDNDGRSKVPVLGDLWLVGWLFQRREVTRERNEIIITLVPRIVPDAPGCRTLDPQDVEQAQTPLLYGDLQQVDRTRFEPKLPCYTVRPRNRQTYSPPQFAPPAQQYVPAYESMQPQEVIEYPAVPAPADMPTLTIQPPVEFPLPSEIRPIQPQ
ncbi:MAG: secretin and TonB N-terminal domain-containing protein, partial [Aureliella sp.]